MDIRKQDAGVWVKANEFPAEPNINLPLRIEGEYFTGYARNYGGGHFWVDARNYPNVHPNNVEWLKPVTGYLLSEDELASASQQKLSVEDLMKSRYKVIADYPNNRLHRVGQIIYPHIESFYESYPHLFKKLEWWEERKESDMPEYVKYYDNSLFYPVPRICKGSEAPFTAAGFTASHFLPATKEEYENQNQQQ